MQRTPWYISGGDDTFDRRVVRTIATVVLTVLAVYLVYRLKTPLLWLLIAMFVAIAVSGPVNLLQKRIGRGKAIASVYVTIMIVPVLLAAVLLPPLVSSAVNLVNKAPHYIKDVKNTLEKDRRFEKLDANFDIEGQLNDLQHNLSDQLGTAAGTLSEIGQWIVNSLFAGFSILILSIFMVSRGHIWLEALGRRRPEPERLALERAFERIGVSVSRYIGGALLQALISGITAFIVLVLIGAPSPLVLATVVALFDVIPLVGATIAALLVGVVTLFVAFPVPTIVWAIYSIGYQQFENYVIQPRIQSEAVNLEPFAILVAVLFGGALMGVIGAVLSIPIAATLMIAAQEWGRYKRHLQELEDEEGSADDAAGQSGAGGSGGGEIAPAPSA